MAEDKTEKTPKKAFVWQMSVTSVDYVDEDGKLKSSVPGFPFKVDKEQIEYLHKAEATRDLTEAEQALQEKRDAALKKNQPDPVEGTVAAAAAAAEADAKGADDTTKASEGQDSGRKGRPGARQGSDDV